jgi:hypothetical protein
VIAGAALLVLVGVGLFVGGVLTGSTALYWGCVAVCVVAAGLLVVARRRLFAEASVGAAAASGGASAQSRSAGSSAAAAVPSDAGPSDGTGDAAAGARARSAAVPVVVPVDLPDPPVEDVEVTDLLLVVDLKDEVLVIDEHPRYHLAGCVHLAGRTTIPLPVDEARTDGFTPCAVCEPDRNLAERARARKAARGS